MIPKPQEGEEADYGALADAEELFALRWRPTYQDLNDSPPGGVPHKTVMLWAEMRGAKAEKGDVKQAFGSIGEEIEDIIEEEEGA